MQYLLRVILIIISIAVFTSCVKEIKSGSASNRILNSEKNSSDAFDEF
jgi:hypothetical protein